MNQASSKKDRMTPIRPVSVIVLGASHKGRRLVIHSHRGVCITSKIVYPVCFYTVKMSPAWMDIVGFSYVMTITTYHGPVLWYL